MLSAFSVNFSQVPIYYVSKPWKKGTLESNWNVFTQDGGIFESRSSVPPPLFLEVNLSNKWRATSMFSVVNPPIMSIMTISFILPIAKKDVHEESHNHDCKKMRSPSSNLYNHAKLTILAVHILIQLAVPPVHYLFHWICSQILWVHNRNIWASV